MFSSTMTDVSKAVFLFLFTLTLCGCCRYCKRPCRSDGKPAAETDREGEIRRCLSETLKTQALVAQDNGIVKERESQTKTDRWLFVEIESAQCDLHC